MQRLYYTTLLISIMLLPCRAMAQCPSNKYQWDFNGSYNLFAAQINSSTSEIITDRQISGNPNGGSITIKYFAYNRLAIAASFGISTESGTMATPYTSGKYTIKNQTVALEIYYVYLFRKYFELYTLAGVGTTNTNEKTHNNRTSSGTNRPDESFAGNRLKMQYTPIALRAGGRLGLFAELGYGYKGLLNMGISFKLGPSCWWKGEFR